MKKEYTLEDISKTINAERLRLFHILNYLINKNSHSLSQGGMDYEGLLKDVEDFEQYLME